MKRMMMIILVLIFLSTISFVVFTKADTEVLTNEKALTIGEEKYLKFLWMIDGAFNDERLNEEFVVNGKKLKEEDKIFTCNYENKKAKECIGYNFDSEFKKLFSDKIDYQMVYSDGISYSWISINDGKYVFNDLDTCSINRMGINQELKVLNKENKKIVYEVLFNNRLINKTIKRDFVLVLEDNEWKIASAFYYDLCGMRYTIY